MQYGPLFPATLIALSLSLGTGPTAAQVDDIDPDAMAGVLDLLVDPDVTADEISKQLSACLQPLYQDALPYAPIVIETEFDAEGRPSEPILLDPLIADASRAELRQLVRAEMAIFDCTPVHVGGSPVIDIRLAFEVNEDMIEIAASTETPVADAVPLGEPGEPAELTRNQRRQAQVRLRLAGSDPGGADGVFGPRTRDAVSKWQDENGFLPTGTLTQSEVEKLWNQTQDAYVAWVEEQKNSQPARRPSTRYYRGRDGCLRYRNGRIVPSQSFKCDAKGLVQSF